jgi:hypothetical protein
MRVLYCDAESTAFQLRHMIKILSQFLGLVTPPTDLRIFSPNVGAGAARPGGWGSQVLENVRFYRPRFVVVDTLRMFWPEAESDSTESTNLVASWKKLSREIEIGCSWLALHHRRKRDQSNAVSLEKDRHLWFQESAGSLALINQSDTRLGLDEVGNDLVLGGFVRVEGWLSPMHLDRVHDDDGNPLGYKVRQGIEFLNDRYREVYDGLPREFRFKDARQALGASDSNTTAFLKQAVGLGVLEHRGKAYVKKDGVSGVKESTEGASGS